MDPCWIYIRWNFRRLDYQRSCWLSSFYHYNPLHTILSPVMRTLTILICNNRLIRSRLWVIPCISFEYQNKFKQPDKSLIKNFEVSFIGIDISYLKSQISLLRSAGMLFPCGVKSEESKSKFSPNASINMGNLVWTFLKFLNSDIQIIVWSEILRPSASKYLQNESWNAIENLKNLLPEFQNRIIYLTNWNYLKERENHV